MNRAVVISAVLLTLLTGLAVAMHHETDALIKLDKEWGATEEGGQEAVDALSRIISDDVLAIGGHGLVSKATMIEEAQDAAPTGPYMADSYEVKFLTDDVAVMVHHVSNPHPHWSLHVWQKKGEKWTVVANANAPDAEDQARTGTSSGGRSPRSLTLAGPGAGGAIIEGLVRVVGAGTLVDLVELQVHNGCLEIAMLVLGGAEVNGTNLTVERSAALPCPLSFIFSDGFESGDTSAWVSQVP